MTTTNGHGKLEQVRDRALRRAYGRVYPGLSWGAASEVGRAEAQDALSAEDVFAVLETDEVLADLGRRGEWGAGPLTPCGGTTHHETCAFHVIVRCVCGASFISTDAGLAFGMAENHARNGRSE